MPSRDKYTEQRAISVSGEVYYVVFTNDDGHWWSPLLHRTIRHCYLIKPDRGRWLVMARSTDGIDLYTADDLSFIDRGSILVKFYAERAKISTLSFNTCVTYCKHALGIRKFWIITPYQLYRWMNEKAKGTEENSARGRA